MAILQHLGNGLFGSNPIMTPTRFPVNPVFGRPHSPVKPVAPISHPVFGGTKTITPVKGGNAPTYIVPSRVTPTVKLGGVPPKYQVS
jgi:hypothetical protein